MLNNALFLATTTFNLKQGDYVIITGGSVGARKGSTDLIKLEVVQ
jgi:hypothetical protein